MMIVIPEKEIPKKAKTFFENPSYVIRFTQPFSHSWIRHTCTHEKKSSSRPLFIGLFCAKEGLDWQLRLVLIKSVFYFRKTFEAKKMLFNKGIHINKGPKCPLKRNILELIENHYYFRWVCFKIIVNTAHMSWVLFSDIFMLYAEAKLTAFILLKHVNIASAYYNYKINVKSFQIDFV